MPNFVKTFEKENKSQFLKYKKYLKEKDWTSPNVNRNKDGRITESQYYYIKDIKVDGIVIHEGKEGEYKLHTKIVKTVLNRLKYFTEFANADIGKSVKADRLVKNMTDIINLHLKRIDNFISKGTLLEEKEEAENSNGKTQKEYKSEDIEFDNLLYKDRGYIKDAVEKLDLKKDNKSTIVELLDNRKAPLSMRLAIEESFPEVKKIVKEMGIDFESKPKNEMFINIENPPEWNTDKHYFEQDKKTLQFYVDEFKKIKNGIVIDGIYITPWMYTHLNVFKSDIPTPFLNKNTGEIESKDVLTNPPLRDNEWFVIQDSYEKARKEGNMLFLCATRRAAKTTLIASRLQATALQGGKELVVAGGSAKDLGQIEKNFKKTIENSHPAFYLPNISNDWSKKVKLGVKKRNQRDILQCVLNIVNLNSGGDKSSEILAGFTPDCFVLDECMKSPFLDQLNAAKPSFDSPYGKRLVPILSGTGSANDALTKDAFKMLTHPEQEGVSCMNWKALERGVDPQYITWQRRDFGTFLPAQMSAKEGMIKVDKTLSDYLGVEKPKGLNKITIKVTDWKNSIEIIKRDRELLKGNKPSLTKEKVYYPIDTEEIFLSGKTNPFPREEIRNYINKIEELGDTGKKVILDYGANGDVVYNLSDKDYPQVPHSGGFIDAPCTIYKDPVPNTGWGHYISTLDDYKAEESDGDSVGSFVILDRFTKEIVASYHSRPDPHNEFYRQGLLLLELYGAECFMENADMGFKTFLDTLGLTDKYLVKSFDMTGDFNLQSVSTRKYGWTPTSQNKSNLFSYFVNTMRKQDSYEDANGNSRVKWGFEKIKDVRILEEMMQYKPGGNFDTIITAMAAYFYDYYLTSIYGAPDPPMTDEEKERERLRRIITKNKIKKKRGMFPKSRGMTFHSRR